jgi:enamine deaminase RidA (YjgF/YER057c/UK114 family)
MTVSRYGSGGEWEEAFGYSQVVVAGPHAYVSGCTAVIDEIVHYEGDPYQQTLKAFGVAFKSLAEVGFDRSDVVRTRMYVVHPRDMAAAGRAHRELFETARPASTIVVVSKLMDAQMLVEIEVDAYREPGGDRGEQR